MLERKLLAGVEFMNLVGDRFGEILVIRLCCTISLTVIRASGVPTS
ncbi:hypothetical protein RINTHM_1230 [Richelia intracellularis HM01]|nr:hypothetical protein RINTHM_1230 [Richelia intracellularis HM01]